MTLSPKCEFPVNRLVVDSSSVSFANDIPFECPVYEDLLFDVLDNNSEVVHHSSQRLLLSSQRLSSVVGSEAARAIVDNCLNNLRNSNVSLYDNVKGIDKLDLSELVRSRYIQTPSEFESYLKHIDDSLQRSKEEKNIKEYFADCYKSYINKPK